MRSPASTGAIPTAALPGSLRATLGPATPIFQASPDLDPATPPPTSRSLSPGSLRQASRRPTPRGEAPADLSPADEQAIPEVAARGDLDRGQRPSDARSRTVPVDLGGGRPEIDAHPSNAPTDLGSDQSRPDPQSVRVAATSSNGQSPGDAQASGAVGSDGDGHRRRDAHPATADPSDADADALLVVLADQLDDIEKARIAADNRLRSLRQVKRLAFSKAAATLQALSDEWAAAEHRVELELKRTMRTHRFGPWVKANKGLGEKQAARLIASIGDPYVRPRLTYEDGTVEEARPRTVSELWSYCGYRPDQGKRKGQSHAYNWEAKMRAFLCAEAALKAGVRKSEGCDDLDGYDLEHRTAITPYGGRYLAERAKWADREVADAHKHAHALRVVAKEILKSLWRYAASDVPAPIDVAPAATEQLRTAKRVSISKADAPSDFQATRGVAKPEMGPSPEPSETP